MNDSITTDIENIAFVLDSKYYSNTDFIRDVIIDKTTDLSYYIDFRFDLGDPSGTATETAKKVIEKIYKYTEILPKYQALAENCAASNPDL